MKNEITDILRELSAKEEFFYSDLIVVARKHGMERFSGYILNKYCQISSAIGPVFLWRYSLKPTAKAMSNPEDIFSDISGHEDVKSLMRNAISSPGNVNLLLLGDFGTGKSMFIRDIKEHLPSIYVEGGNATAVGILEQVRKKVYEEGITAFFLLIDEIDKMVSVSKKDTDRFAEQEKLANLIDTASRLTKSKFDMKGTGAMTFDKKLDGFKVIATANRLFNISPLLQSRFGQPIRFRQYNKSELYSVGVTILSVRYKMPAALAEATANMVVNEQTDVNMREIDKLGEIIHSFEDLDRYRKSISGK